MKSPNRLLPLLVLPPLLAGCGDAAGKAERADIYTVSRGDLPIRITEQGELQPFQSTNIKNKMEGRTTIIYLIPEGETVEAGQRLVELDSSELLDRKAQQGISLSRAEADALAAGKELEIRRKEAEAELLAAQDALRIAEIDLEKFLGKEGEDGTRDMGEREQQRIDAEANIQLAEQELKLAEDKLKWSRTLHEKGFITKDELERDQIDTERRKKNLQVAQNQLEILTKFTFPKEMIALQQAVRQTEIDVESARARGEARVAQATADLEAKEKEHELALERYQNLEEQIDHSVLYAPTPGLVVYASDDGWRRDDDIIEEGTEVRERQTLIVLPDVTRMVAHVKVHEAVVDKVEVGQPAIIKVQAKPERSWTGHVRRVSPVADSGSRWSNNELKVYKTEVALDGINEDEELKPNMTAEVTIIVDQLEDILYVPLPAVRRKGSVTYAWVQTPAGPVARRVQLGDYDFQFVVVRDGLEEGDRVFLAVPPGVQEPEFPGAAEEASSPLEVPTASGADSGDGAGNRPAGDTSRLSGPPEGGRGGTDEPDGRRPANEDGGRSEMRAAMQRFQSLLRRKHPKLADEVAGDRRAFLTNDRLRDAIEQDAELREARDALVRQFRRGGVGDHGRRQGGSEDAGSGGGR